VADACRLSHLSGGGGRLETLAAQLLSTQVRYVDAAGQEVETTLGDVDAARLTRALPVRRVGSRAGQKHYSGLFWSSTTRGHVPYESRLELDRLWLADFDTEVTWIAAQPMWLSGVDGEVCRRHAPDLLLTSGGHVVLVDVKPSEFAALPEVRAVFEWTSRLCRARGWTYEVFTGGDPVVLANIRALAVGRRCAVPELSFPRAAGVVGAFSDAWYGRLTVDLNTPIQLSDFTGGTNDCC